MNDDKMPAPETEDGQHGPVQDKRQMLLWAVVGGVAVCVIAVWALLLPLQLQKEKVRGLSGWLFSQEASVNGENLRNILDETAQTFNQGINDLQHQAKLDAPLAPTSVDPAIVAKLRARIEEEAAKKDEASVNAAVSTQNAPKTLPSSESAKK